MYLADKIISIYIYINKEVKTPDKIIIFFLSYPTRQHLYIINIVTIITKIDIITTKYIKYTR